jgi:hypothetical protein
MPDPLAGVKACVFDAYGTLFDFASAARASPDVPPEVVERLSGCGATSSCSTRGCAPRSTATRIFSR